MARCGRVNVSMALRRVIDLDEHLGQASYICLAIFKICCPLWPFITSSIIFSKFLDKNFTIMSNTRFGYLVNPHANHLLCLEKENELTKPF